MKIERKAFRTEADYEAALRDAKKIEQLKKEYNTEQKEDVAELYRKLLSGSLKFESRIGQEFDDMIYEKYQELKPDITAKKTSSPTNKKHLSQKSNFKKENSGKKNADNKQKTKNSQTPKIKLEDFDSDMQKQILAEMKKNEQKRRIMVSCCVVAAVLCIGYFFVYYIVSYRSQSRWQNLAQLVGTTPVTMPQQTANIQVNLDDGEDFVMPEILSKYENLYNSNKSIIGWIKIDDTIIDYPVMQCENNEYYLNHNFDQEEDRAGALFLDCRCDVVHGNDNYIIYGHHLSSGRMFSSLPEYESIRYYEQHPYITFDTIYEEQQFQVMYVFRSRVYNEEDVVFKYYDFINVNSEEEFNSYMAEMAEASFYDTGVTAVYGDTLLTLSTCDYNETNGRFVVVAKRIR